jgi:hypothetical protein
MIFRVRNRTISMAWICLSLPVSSSTLGLPAHSENSIDPSTYRTPISGGVVAYADAPSSIPLLKGNECLSLPEQWKGVWNGSVQLNDTALAKQIPSLDQQNNHLTGSTAKMSFKLAAESEGPKIPIITVTEPDRQNDLSPDIIFFRTGDNGHLWVLPGASIVERGENGVGDVHIGGNVFIGDGVHIGTRNSVNSASVNSVQAKPASANTVTANPTSASASRNNGQPPLINYHNSGITFGGPTSFNGRYFRADNALGIANGTTIRTGRVDIGSARMSTNGTTIDVSGTPSSGYIVNRIANPVIAGNARGTGDGALTDTAVKDGRIAGTYTVMVAPGVYDQRTISPIENANGTIGGYREMVARYTALSADKMLVQISISSPNPKDKGLSMSGYLTKVRP